MDSEWWLGVAQQAVGEVIGTALAAIVGFFALRATGSFREVPLRTAVKAVSVAALAIAALVIALLLVSFMGGSGNA
jgi:ABC-type Fe3+ transport system permease subunit